MSFKVPQQSAYPPRQEPKRPIPTKKIPLPLIMAGASLFLVSGYGTFLYYKLKMLAFPAEAKDLEKQRIDPTVWNKVAGEYDKSIDRDELLFGHRLMRRWLVKHAKGDALEVSTGTARNLPYYKDLTTLTLTDSSEKMVEIAKEKYKKRGDAKFPVYFHSVDAHILPAPDNTFDTIVSTFGLCSCEDPVAELKEMARVCKPNGQMLLLEHGKGKYEFLNDALDKTSADHAKRWGCWWNRDIPEIVKQAGLTVDYEKRWHLGTTYYILATPNKS